MKLLSLVLEKKRSVKVASGGEQAPVNKWRAEFLSPHGYTITLFVVFPVKLDRAETTLPLKGFVSVPKWHCDFHAVPYRYSISDRKKCRPGIFAGSLIYVICIYVHEGRKLQGSVRHPRLATPINDSCISEAGDACGPPTLPDPPLFPLRVSRGRDSSAWRNAAPFCFRRSCRANNRIPRLQ